MEASEPFAADGGQPEFVVAMGSERDISDGCPNHRDLHFQCSSCERIYKVRIGCGNRFDTFCPKCAARWRRRTFQRFYRGVTHFKNPKFLTLTLLKQRLADGRVSNRVVDKLFGLWAMKKRLFFYLARRGYQIASWCAVIEPPNHIHLIIDSEYIPQKEISEIWRTVTGGSFIVDIKALRGNPREIAAYISKYLSKASKWQGVNLDLLKGFHLIGSWGLKKGREKPPFCLCGMRRPLYRLTDFEYRDEMQYFEKLTGDNQARKFGIYLYLGRE